MRFSNTPSTSSTSFAFQKFHHFFVSSSKRRVTTSSIRDESRCARKVPFRPLSRDEAYTVNGCRHDGARKILIKVRYLAKRPYFTSHFSFPLRKCYSFFNSWWIARMYNLCFREIETNITVRKNIDTKNLPTFYIRWDIKLISEPTINFFSGT